MAVKYYHAVGKRKTSIARVFLKFGYGNIVINKKDFEEYFPNVTRFKENVLRPLKLVNLLGKVDLYITVKGGGMSSQSEAIRHGIARALVKVKQEYSSVLKPEGLLTRDARIKERKKYGRKRARKRFQFSKR